MKAEIVDMVDRAKAQCEEKLAVSEQNVARAQEQARAESEKRALAEARLEELLSGAAKTGTCDCCGKEDIPEDQLSGIDSGQILCSDCLEALRG